ncbi:MAG: LptF/LptG family permease [Fimbriimonadaceae bacterium]|nr:LptF/LptG family permease [Chitinophagales bacterium]
MNKLWNLILFPFRRWTTLYDRYIIRQFLTTTLFTFLVILAISIVIDYSEKTGHFVKKNPPSSEVFGYYMDFIPYILSQLAPLLIFLSVIIFTSRLAYNSEIIAVFNSGATYRRFLRPYIICAIFSGLLLLYANHWIVPEANKGKMEFEAKYIKPPKNFESNIHLRLDKNTFVSLERFKFKNNEGTNFTIEKYTGTGTEKRLAYKINSDKIQLLPGENKWRLNNYKRWEINGLQEGYTTGKILDTVLNMQPDDFDVSETIKETLNYAEMEDFIKEEKIKGTGGIEFFKVEQYRRTSYALSVIIMVIMGAAAGSKKIRGGIGLNLVFAIALSSLFVVFQQFSATFSTRGSLPPIIGTNIPNLIFLVITVYIVRNSSR